MSQYLHRFTNLFAYIPVITNTVRLFIFFFSDGHCRQPRERERLQVIQHQERLLCWPLFCVSKCEIEADKYCNEDSFGLSLNFQQTYVKTVQLDKKKPGGQMPAEGKKGGGGMFNSMENEERGGKAMQQYQLSCASIKLYMIVQALAREQPAWHFTLLRFVSCWIFCSLFPSLLPSFPPLQIVKSYLSCEGFGCGLCVGVCACARSGVGGGQRQCNRELSFRSLTPGALACKKCPCNPGTMKP